MDMPINDFLADLELAGRVPGTRKKHQLELLRLGHWLAGEGLEWDAISRHELQRYARLRAGKSFSTRANMLSILRVFYAWAEEQGYCRSPATTFKTPTRPKPLPRALSLDQVRALISHLAAQPGRRARRDEALMLTGLYAGLRACELAPLCWPAVDLDAGVINVMLSKGGKGRAVQVHSALTTVLRRWREEQGLGTGAPVFSLAGEAIKPARVGKVARRVAKETGLPLTAHVLRHTFATWSLRRSGNLYAVSKALGHADVKQTEIYIATATDDSRAAVEALPNLDAW